LFAVDCRVIVSGPGHCSPVVFVIDIFVEKDRNGLIIEIALTVSSMRMIVSKPVHVTRGVSVRTIRGREPAS
jgi:hypothetical protein